MPLKKNTSPLRPTMQVNSTPKTEEGYATELQGCIKGPGVERGHDEGSNVTRPPRGRKRRGGGCQHRRLTQRRSSGPDPRKTEPGGSRRDRLPRGKGCLTSNAAWGSCSMRASEKLRNNLPGKERLQEGFTNQRTGRGDASYTKEKEKHAPRGRRRARRRRRHL